MSLFRVGNFAWYKLTVMIAQLAIMLVFRARLWELALETASKCFVFDAIGQPTHLLCSFPLRPILRKDLTLRSNQTGTKEDIEAAMKISASGHVACQTEVMQLSDINLALQRVKRGEVLGKLVLDVRPETLGS